MLHLKKRLDEVSQLVYQLPFMELTHNGKDIVVKALQADALENIASVLLEMRPRPDFMDTI